jgi:lipopolysaccharide export system permease protein
MKVLTGYLFREFFKLVLICEGIFLFLFLTVDFLQKVDNFIKAGVQKKIMIIYFAYRMPLVAMSMLPPASLISVFFIC